VTKKATATPNQPCAAGVYTAPILLPLVAHLLESFGALDQLVPFSSTNGRAFYKVEARNLRSVTLRKEPFRITENLSLKGDDVAPFWAGKELNWSIASENVLT
jgi:dihydroorotase